ncbi:uncharacterized protein LOC128986518 [Macrosteles quadrilineatus]|uniref:uncharacterized protein LOC128986518 n=1 Tax=Macrosteles quadrilineatus TaxID=74068 RepID=UPI0023E2EF1E|nr:uncharacterized protein LOC128986518 [Macrosteles quadrilineatus]
MKTSVTLLICVCVHHVATSPLPITVSSRDGYALPQFDYPETSFSGIPTSLSDMGLPTDFRRHTGVSSGLNNRFSSRLGDDFTSGSNNRFFSRLDDDFTSGLGNKQQIDPTQSYLMQCVHRPGTGLSPTTLCSVWQSVGGNGGFPSGNGGITGGNGGGNGGGTRDYPDPRGEEEGGGSEETNEGVPTDDDAELVKEYKASRRGQRVIGSQYNHF